MTPAGSLIATDVCESMCVRERVGRWASVYASESACVRECVRVSLLVLEAHSTPATSWTVTVVYIVLYAYTHTNLVVGIRGSIVLLELRVSTMQAVKGSFELVGIPLHVSKRLEVLRSLLLLLVNNRH